MASVISQFVCGARNTISQGFRGLPVILGSTILVLGMIQGNINLLFFFVGLCILAPTSALIINILWELVFNNTPWWLSIPEVLWKLDAATSETCSIYPTMENVSAKAFNVVPSYWITMMAFFFTYLFSNALMLYNAQQHSKAPKSAVEARKSQAVSSMILVCLMGVVSLIVRYATGCETGLGLLLSCLLGSSLAYGWYTFMRNCGLGRLDDLFGISNRILPMQSYETSDPTVCLPS
jgi:hypothetical protein